MTNNQKKKIKLYKNNKKTIYCYKNNLKIDLIKY